jgi:hypothetical protein
VGNYRVYYFMILANVLGLFMKLSYKCLTVYFNQFILLTIRASLLFMLNRVVLGYEGLCTHIPSPKGNPTTTQGSGS